MTEAIKTLRAYVTGTLMFQDDGDKRSEAIEAIDELDDHIDWINKGVDEWRGLALARGRQLDAAQATARVAIGHLHAVLNQCRSADDQQRADTAARDWLISIGSEPT